VDETVLWVLAGSSFVAALALFVALVVVIKAARQSMRACEEFILELLAGEVEDGTLRYVGEQDADLGDPVIQGMPTWGQAKATYDIVADLARTVRPHVLQAIRERKAIQLSLILRPRDSDAFQAELDSADVILSDKTTVVSPEGSEE
jgi:hypothetical protein